MNRSPKELTHKQADDQNRVDQKSHGSKQNRSKKDGHTDQIGSGQDQTSQRQKAAGTRRPVS